MVLTQSQAGKYILLNGGNVGIGTTTPVGNLHVNRTVNTQATGIFNTIMANDVLTASVSGTPAFVVKNSGNVGIGTALPTARLHVGDGGDFLAGQTTGKLGFGGAVSGSDYLMNMTLDSTQDWARGINISQAND